MPRRLSVLYLFTLLILSTVRAGAAPQPVPPPDALTTRTTYAELQTLLQSIAPQPHVTITSQGTTLENRAVQLVTLRGDGAPTWKVLVIGGQHGDEPAGAEAAVWMIRHYASDPARVPAGVELSVVPFANPDGLEAGRRTNAARADLNRDHIQLAQPETRTLHAIQRRLLAHVVVDCHEFTRDSRDFRDAGYDEWPLVMMDCASAPLFGPALYEAGLRWVEGAHAPMPAAGINYIRYVVGGVPPDGEQRFSTLQPDDARNGLAMYNNLGFIIESGVKRSAPDPDADFGQRVAAHVLLLRRFVEEPATRAADRALIEQARSEALPPFIPVNHFWASVAGQPPRTFRLINRATSRTVDVPAGNFMTERVIKRSVPTPSGYAIAAEHAAFFRPLLDAHGLACEELTTTRALRAERCTLERIEKDPDEVYGRYAGRQIVTRAPAEPVTLGPGALLVRLTPPQGLRAVLVLEPCSLYGLYQFEAYFNRVDASRQLPVLRLLESPRF